MLNCSEDDEGSRCWCQCRNCARSRLIHLGSGARKKRDRERRKVEEAAAMEKGLYAQRGYSPRASSSCSLASSSIGSSSRIEQKPCNPPDENFAKMTLKFVNGHAHSSRVGRDICYAWQAYRHQSPPGGCPSLSVAVEHSPVFPGFYMTSISMGGRPLCLSWPVVW